MSTKRKRPQTKNQGATDERTAHLAHFRSLHRRAKNEGMQDWIDKNLIQWSLKREARFNRKPRGLGRK